METASIASRFGVRVYVSACVLNIIIVIPAVVKKSLTKQNAETE